MKKELQVLKEIDYEMYEMLVLKFEFFIQWMANTNITKLDLL